MKKTLFLLLIPSLFMTFITAKEINGAENILPGTQSLFAPQDEIVFQPALLSDETVSEKEPFWGFTTGFRISILGLEPHVGLIAGNFEAEVSAAIVMGLEDSTRIAALPIFSAGYNITPFMDSGFSHAIGVEYALMPPIYARIYLLDIIDVLDNPLHSISIYYRGAWELNSLLSLAFRLRLPLIIFGGGDDSVPVGIVNGVTGIAAGLGLLAITPSIGLRFTIY